MLKEKDLDIVLIATPDHWHALPMIAAVKPGPTFTFRNRSASTSTREKPCWPPRKHQRVVQVGTQRRSTPHLIEARDRIIREGKLGKVGLVEVYCYYHMRNSENPADTDPPEYLDWNMWTGPAPLRPYNGSLTPGAGARSWNTAMASWVICASICSTWCAGCSSLAGLVG